MKNLNWDSLKQLIDSGSVFLKHIESDSNYEVIGVDGALLVSCTLYKGSVESVDFENNYKASSNKSIAYNSLPAFASKVLNGKSLFKRVHGVSASIDAGETKDIDIAIAYPVTKFTGAEIFNTEVGDVVNFTVHDTATNTYSGAPTSPLPTFYPNYKLNQFGLDVQMPKDRYANTSNYDADIYQGMIIRCSYKNNGASTKSVYMNVWLHEVK